MKPGSLKLVQFKIKYGTVDKYLLLNRQAPDEIAHDVIKNHVAKITKPFYKIILNISLALTFTK